MPSVSEPDELLMAQVAKGLREPLEPLVRRYALPLTSFIGRMIGDLHRSEELFQDVFLSVWRKRSTYEFPRPFRPWVYTIALNACRADLRLRKPINQPYGDDLAAPIADGSPVEAAIATETATRIKQAIAALPAQARAVVVMRIWDGLSYSQIADAVDCSEATARSHMSHGLAALRTALGSTVGEC